MTTPRNQFTQIAAPGGALFLCQKVRFLGHFSPFLKHVGRTESPHHRGNRNEGAPRRLQPRFRNPAWLQVEGLFSCLFDPVYFVSCVCVVFFFLSYTFDHSINVCPNFSAIAVIRFSFPLSHLCYYIHIHLRQTYSDKHTRSA